MCIHLLYCPLLVENQSEPPLHFGGICDTNVIIWHYKEHYEPIQLLCD